MQITLIRHLPTEWNKYGRLQGQRDIPVSFEDSLQMEPSILGNQKQIEQSGPFGIVLASSLVRAQQTAEIYGYADAIIEPLLNELNFGAFEGRPKQDLIKHFSDDWFRQPLQIKLGESVADLENRVRLVLHHYGDFQRVLIFGHGSWIRALLSINRYGNINHMNQVKVDNNELIQLSMEGEKDERAYNI